MPRDAAAPNCKSTRTNATRFAPRFNRATSSSTPPDRFTPASTALVEAAIDIGFDVIDINDDLRYAESMLALAPRIDAAGIRVLSSASSVSAVAAAVVATAACIRPRRVTAFLAPASRHTANAGAALSLIRSVGRPVRVFRDGRCKSASAGATRRRFRMPPPLGTIHGRLFESADAVHLPRIWPTLRDVAMYVDTNTPGVNSAVATGRALGRPFADCSNVTCDSDTAHRPHVRLLRRRHRL